MRTDAVSFGSLSVLSSQPTATQMKMSLKEALDVAATTSPVIMLCILDPVQHRQPNTDVHQSCEMQHLWVTRKSNQQPQYCSGLLRSAGLWTAMLEYACHNDEFALTDPRRNRSTNQISPQLFQQGLHLCIRHRAVVAVKA